MSFFPSRQGPAVDTSVLVSHTEKTSLTTITATTEGTADTIITAPAFTPNGTDTYLFEFWSPQVSIVAAVNLIFYLYDGASSIGFYAVILGSTGGSTQPAPMKRRLVPSNASHTYSVRASRASGTCNVQAGNGTAGNYPPAYFRITLDNP